MVVSVVSIGNSRGIRFPNYVLKSLKISNKVDMEVKDNGIFLTPIIDDTPRKNWAEAFAKMHEDGDDKMEEFPDSEAFEWEW